MRVTSQIEEAYKQVHEHEARLMEVVDKMEERDAALQALPDDVDDEEREFYEGRFLRAEAEAKKIAAIIRRWEKTLGLLSRRLASPVAVTATTESAPRQSYGRRRGRGGRFSFEGGHGEG